MSNPFAQLQDFGDDDDNFVKPQDNKPKKSKPFFSQPKKNQSKTRKWLPEEMNQLLWARNSLLEQEIMLKLSVTKDNLNQLNRFLKVTPLIEEAELVECKKYLI